MAFPQSVLPVRVRIAPGGQPAADPATWVWVDITSSVRVASDITIEFGKSDEGARVDPGKCTLTLDNRSGDFSTRNALGQWYGRLNKNTPLRVGTIAIADTFTRTVSNGWGSTDNGRVWGVSGSVADWSVSSGTGQLTYAAANVTRSSLVLSTELNDVDAQYTASVPAVMTGAAMVIGLMVRYIDNNNNYVLACEFNAGGAVTAKIRKFIGGVGTVLASAVDIAGLAYTANQKLRVRVQADGPALRMKIWVDGTDEPDDWTLTTSDTSIVDAGGVGFYLWLVAGNTNTKPFNVSVDDLEVEAVEFTGTVPEWAPRWDKSRKDVTSPITAAGILRRLQQGKSPLRPPITRALLRLVPVALWPFDDSSDSTAAASALSGGTLATVRAAEPAQETPILPGALQTTGITASTVMSGRVPSHTATGTWACIVFVQLLAPPAAATRLITISSTGTVRFWAIDLDSTTITLRGYDADGVLLLTAGAIYPTEVTPPRWIAFDVLVAQSGGNVVGKIIEYGVGVNPESPLMYFTSDTIAGSAGSPTGWSMQGSLGFNGGRFGPLAFFNYEPPFVTLDFSRAANGYIGELAADRVARLCLEESVQVVVEAGDSEPLGPQRTDTFLNLLYAAEDADLGILYERGAGLAYRPRGARYNRPVELALDFDPGDVAEPPEPTDDDQQLRNMWTITRDKGASAVAADQSSIDRVGLLDDSATINVATDDVLADHASWRLRLGTVDEYRWPSIALNLARNTSQIRHWRAAQPFPRMTIANEPDEVAGNAVDVTVLGHTQTLGPFGWDVVLNCVASSPWQVAVLDDPDAAADTTDSSLDTSVNTSATTLIVDTNSGPAWSTVSADYPQDIEMGGEQITLGSPPSGSTSPQTFTGVTRSVNGIVKSHDAGAGISLWAAAYPAL